MTFMNHQSLRALRKKSPLKQSDISFLLGINEDARISHWERGRREPNAEVKLFYHALFNLPIASLFAHIQDKVSNDIVERLKLRIAQLEVSHKDARTLSRLQFLQEALARLIE